MAPLGWGGGGDYVVPSLEGDDFVGACCVGGVGGVWVGSWAVFGGLFFSWVGWVRGRVRGRLTG